MKKHSVLWNMQRKTRREREVTTDPKRMKSTENPHPGKKLIEMGNPVANTVRVCTYLS